MFKKLNTIIAIAMMLVMPMNQARAEQVNLKDAVNQLNFNLTVVWDQSDQAFYQQSLKDFAAKIDALKAQGMSNEQLVNSLKTQVLSARANQDLERIASIAKDQKLSGVEITKLVTQSAMTAQHDGAHYSDDASIELLSGIIIAVVVIAIVVGVENSGGTIIVGCEQSCSYDIWGDYNCYCN